MLAEGVSDSNLNRVFQQIRFAYGLALYFLAYEKELYWRAVSVFDVIPPEVCGEIGEVDIRLPSFRRLVV